MTAIEIGCPYTITVGGDVVTMNQPTDANYVGRVLDVTGLDMYGIRENAQVVAAGDGGYHGPFWRDRRPFTVSGVILPTMPVTTRNAAQDRLIGTLANALRQDGEMRWTGADNIEKAVYFRTQQSVRITKGQSNVEKMFLVAAVARDWRIVATTRQTVSTGGAALPATVVATNNGNADAAPIFRVTGPIAWPVIRNTTTGKQMEFYNTSSLAAGDSMLIDLTGPYPVVTNNGGDVSGAMDPINSDYTIAVAPGANNFQLASGSGVPGNTAQTNFEVDWNDSWH